jgi:hypothetical protein
VCVAEKWDVEAIDTNLEEIVREDSISVDGYTLIGVYGFECG